MANKVLRSVLLRVEAMQKDLKRLSSDLGMLREDLVQLCSESPEDGSSQQGNKRRLLLLDNNVCKKVKSVEASAAGCGGGGGSGGTFERDEEGFVVVYTDGACENNGRPNAKAGVGVWFGPNHPLNYSGPVSGRATNNVGEIQAAVRAINIAKEAGVDRLAINTDSQFMINAMTKWIHAWKKKGWRLADGGPVKNQEDFTALDAACRQLEVKWKYVAGHSGIVGNEAADCLAVQGAKMYTSS